MRRTVEACQKRGVAVPTWSINGGFVVVTFMRPTKGVPQDKELDDWVEKQIRNNTQISTEDLAELSNLTIPKNY